MLKIEQLKAILSRLQDLKQQGEDNGVDEKIAEVKKTLEEHIKYPF